MINYRFDCLIGGVKYQSNSFQSFKACHEAMCAANKLSDGAILPWVESCKVIAFQSPPSVPVDQKAQK
jgi:hypothetical protein